MGVLRVLIPATLALGPGAPLEPVEAPDGAGARVHDVDVPGRGRERDRALSRRDQDGLLPAAR